MVGGKQRAYHIPTAWAADVQRRVAAGRAFKEALAEVLAANAQLLVLERRQRRR
jgi:predicted ABC-type transport system involved in lysophospholipase L1 biosynthesis ATPase subunit